jgi:hypothetical protein
VTIDDIIDEAISEALFVFRAHFECRHAGLSHDLFFIVDGRLTLPSLLLSKNKVSRFDGGARAVDDRVIV